MPRRTRVPALLAVGLLTAAGGLCGPAAPAAAISACAFPAGQEPAPVVGDVDGDSGSDVVVGRPRTTDDHGQPVGAVDLRLGDGGAQQLTAARLAFRAAAAAGFGSAVGLADLDHDGCADLAIGAPGEGAVYLAHGSSTGVTAQGVTRLASPGADGDGFGAAIALAARPGSEVTDLWVGAPSTRVAGLAAAGRVYHYVVDATGAVSPAGSTDYREIPGGARAGDHFGSVLTGWRAGVVVGVPRRAVAGHAGAGEVVVLGTDADAPVVQVISQATPAVAGPPERGDGFGAAVATDPSGFSLLVGAPGEDVGRATDAGSAEILRAPEGVFLPQSEVHQGAAGVPGRSEAGDRFGAAVAIGRATDCAESFGYTVGAPGEDIGNVRDAGAVTVFVRDEDISCSPRVLRQGTTLGGRAEAHDALGTSVATLRDRDDQSEETRDRLLVGVPGEDGGAGVVVVTAQSARSTGYAPLGAGPRAEGFGRVLAAAAAGVSS